MPFRLFFVTTAAALIAVGVFASAQEESATVETPQPAESAASIDPAPVEPVADEEADAAPEPAADAAAAKEPTADTPVLEPAEVEPTPSEAPAEGPAVVVPDAALAARPGASALASETDAARSTLEQAADAFEQLVNPSTDFGAGWLDYLRWDGMRAQLDGDESIEIAPLRATLRQLNSGAEGLERPEARAVASAVEQMIAVASLSRARDPQAVVASQSEALAELAAKEQLDPRLDLYAIERRITLLSATKEGAAAIADARSAYDQPNTHFALSAELLNRMLASPNAECIDINECILGTRVRGAGLTDSSLRVSLQPSPDVARLRFDLAGTTSSRTRGVNGPVAIRSLGTTTFNASKSVVLSDSSFMMGAAAASASTNSRTQSISKIGGGIGSRIIERIAQGRVAEQRPQADAISGQRAQRRVASRFNQRLDERLVEARQKYETELIAPLARRGAAPQWVNFSSTSDALEVRTLQANDDQLAAPSSPPSALAGEMVASVHESAASNLLSAYLGGATLRRDEPDGPPIYEGGVKPKWLDQLGDDDRPTLAEFKPWALTFRSERPVSVSFRDGKVQIAVHAAQLATEEKTYEGWDLISTYEPVRAGEGWALERLGDVEVLPTGFDPAAGRPLPSKKGATRRNLQEALNEADGRLPSRVPLDDIVLDEPAGAVSTLAVEDIQISEGWLQASLRGL